MSEERPVIEATHRICSECGNVRHRSEFLSNDDLTCKHCHTRMTAQQANRELEKLQAGLAHTAVYEMAATRKGTHINAPHITEAVALGVQMLGGLDGLMSMYTQSLQASFEEDKASRKTLDHLWKFMALITASTEHRTSAPDVEGLSEDEILVEYQALAMQSITSNAAQFREMVRLVQEQAPQLLEYDGGQG